MPMTDEQIAEALNLAREVIALRPLGGPWNFELSCYDLAAYVQPLAIDLAAARAQLAARDAEIARLLEVHEFDTGMEPFRDTRPPSKKRRRISTQP